MEFSINKERYLLFWDNYHLLILILAVSLTRNLYNRGIYHFALAQNDTIFV